MEGSVIASDPIATCCALSWSTRAALPIRDGRRDLDNAHLTSILYWEDLPQLKVARALEAAGSDAGSFAELLYGKKKTTL